MTVKSGQARKRGRMVLLGVFVLLGLLAGAGYAVLKPLVLTSTALVALPANLPKGTIPARIADSTPVLEPSLRSIHPAVALPTLRSRIQTKRLSPTMVSVLPRE